MARNRKNQSAAIRFGPALRAFVLCAMIVSACLGYVWLKKQIDELGHQMRRKEARLRELREQNDKLRKQLAWLQSPKFLDQRVREMKLGLLPPQPANVLHLPEPAADRPAPPAAQQFAAGQPAGLSMP